MGTMNQLFGGGTPPKWVSGTYSEGYVAWSPTDYQYYMNKTTGVRATDPANDLPNWQPTGERAIKSIQRGVIAISAGSQTGTATITAVVTAKTELRMLGFSTSGADNTFYPRISLTDSVTVTATKIATAGSGTNVSWELTERY